MHTHTYTYCIAGILGVIEKICLVCFYQLQNEPHPLLLKLTHIPKRFQVLPLEVIGKNLPYKSFYSTFCTLFFAHVNMHHIFTYTHTVTLKLIHVCS